MLGELTSNINGGRPIVGPLVLITVIVYYGISIALFVLGLLKTIASDDKKKETKKEMIIRSILLAIFIILFFVIRVVLIKSHKSDIMSLNIVFRIAVITIPILWFLAVIGLQIRPYLNPDY